VISWFQKLAFKFNLYHYVTASFSQMHFNMATIELPSEEGTLEAGGRGAMDARKGASSIEDSMAALEGEVAANAAAPNVSGFVKGHTEGGDVGGAGAAVDNPDEIDIGDDDSDDDSSGADAAPVVVEQAAVPEGVFGGMKRAVEEEEEGGEEPAGALDRFKKRRTAE
jgi:hypothetical protein